MEKIILTDIDDTILHWAEGFTDFISKKGIDIPVKPLHQSMNVGEWLKIDDHEENNIILEFHFNEVFSNLRPYDCALTVLPKLKNMGYTFVAISAANNDKPTWEFRKTNLEKFFPNIFSDIIHTGWTANSPKINYLKQYDSSIWIEDNYHNAIDGLKCNHSTFLIERKYNKFCRNDDIIYVTDWNDIFHRIK